MITQAPQKNTKYVVLRGISPNGIPTRFFTMHTPGLDYASEDYGVAYEVLGYAARVRDCQVFLYGHASCDHDD